MKNYILLILLCGAALAAHAQPGPGFALRFDGSGNYVAVPHTAALNALPLTVMAWVKASAGGDLVNKYVSGSLNGWDVFIRAGHVRAWYFRDSTRFIWDGGDGLDGGIITDGVWHQVAFTVDASGGKLYVDGVLRASRAWTGTPGAPTTTQQVRLGIDSSGTVRLNGQLDEVSLWNVALSQSLIQSFLYTPLAGDFSGFLMALYHCDEGGGTLVADSAPPAGDNSGTWVGTPMFAPTVVAPQAGSDGGTPRGDCSTTPGITEVNLDWRGENLAGCKVTIDYSRSRIRRLAPDCTTIYTADLPSQAPRRWTILSQPPGASAQLTVTSNGVTLTLPLAGDYTVQLEVCPGDCVVPGPDGNNFPLVPSVGTVTVRAETELPLRVQERPVLPPSAMAPTPRLDLSESRRACITSGGGGFINPQWVTVNSWTGPDDYKLVEGSVVSAWPSTHGSLLNHDLAFNGGDWYVINDVTMSVSPDPRYYNLLSMKPESERNPHLLAC